nr:MAG TPA: hypothetical protein [Caudoviricetes sp.]
MTNNTQKFFEAFAKTECNAYLGNASFNNSALRNPKFLEQAAKALAGYLESPDAESWLDFQVYRNDGSDEYWAEATVALDGPTASFTYDSYRERLTFDYSWAGESLSVDVDTDAGAGADVAQLIRDYAEA